MKKQALLLFAGGLMALASCTSETHNDMSQAQIDSTVNARVEEIRMEMMRQNDSLINAMALIKADSIIAAMKGGHSVTTKTTTTRTTTVSPGKGGETVSGAKSTSTTVESGGLKSQSDKNRVNNVNTVQGGGLKSQSDQNKTNTKSGGLKSQSDQSKTGGK